MLEVGESGELQDIGGLFLSQSDRCEIAVVLGPLVRPAVRVSLYSTEVHVCAHTHVQTDRHRALHPSAAVQARTGSATQT